MVTDIIGTWVDDPDHANVCGDPDVLGVLGDNGVVTACPSFFELTNPD